MAYLAWRAIEKRYDGVAALDGVTLALERGKLLAVLGPSGCGKTTLLRVTAGLEAPDAGSVTLDGADLGPLPPERRGIGLVFQEYALFPHLDVAGNVGFGLRMARWPRRRAAERVAAMLGLVGLAGYGRRRVQTLSGGEQQRVALARGLAPGPRVLMLDEPLGALDASLRTALLDEVPRILRAAGATTVYVTHDQEEALYLADRVALVRAGRVVQHGRPADLVDHPADAFVAGFLRLGALVPVLAAGAGAAGAGLVARGGVVRGGVVTPLGRLPPRHAGGGHGTAASTGGVVLVRHDAVRFAPGPRLVPVRARVTGVQAASRGAQVRVALEGDGGWSAEVRCPLAAGTPAPRHGPTRAWLDPGRLVLLPTR